MIALAIVLAALLLIALFRFGLSVEYGADGVKVVLYIGPVRNRLYPGKEKGPKEKISKEKKEKKKKEKISKKRKPEEEKPGKLETALSLLPAIKKALSRLRRRLLIKRLRVRYAAAGEDPYKTALAFGASEAVFGIVLAVAEKSFRIRRRDFSAYADFNATEQCIYVFAAISIAVWEAVYVLFPFVPVLLKSKSGTGTTSTTRTASTTRATKTRLTGKDVGFNGKAPDKRTDGNDDAKGQRDGRRQHDSGGADNDG